MSVVRQMESITDSVAYDGQRPHLHESHGVPQSSHRATPSGEQRHCACGQVLHDNRRKRCRRCQAVYSREVSNARRRRNTMKDINDT
jgi:hypothetical protein